MADLRGLVILGYPLHAVGEPKQRRWEHLLRVDVPVLFAQGSRDALGTAEEMRPILPALPKGTELYVVEGGDHSFVVPRREAHAQEQVHDRVQQEILRWMVQVVQSGPPAGSRTRARPIAARKREQLRLLHRRAT